MDLLSILIKQKEGGVLTSIEEDLIATIDATMSKVKKEKQVSELQERINRCKVEITTLTEQQTIKNIELSDLKKQLDDLKPKLSTSVQSKPKLPWLTVCKKSITPDSKAEPVHNNSSKDESINWSKICKSSGFEPGLYNITAESNDDTFTFDLTFTRLNTIVELPEGFPFVDRNTIQFADINLQNKCYYPILAKGGVKIVISDEFIAANR
jgi:regulator of replication initiation timing